MVSDFSGSTVDGPHLFTSLEGQRAYASAAPLYSHVADPRRLALAHRRRRMAPIGRCTARIGGRLARAVG